MADAIQQQLTNHLDALLSNPATTAIDIRLVENAGLVLPDQLVPEQTNKLVQQISTLLQNVQQDPTPLTQLLEKLLQHFSFSDVLSFEPPVDFANGLRSGTAMTPINMLMLYLLQKATNTTDTATVAGWPEVVRALVKLWLATPDTGVTTRAASLLCDFLAVDKPTVAEPGQQLPDSHSGQGLMWKRIFSDADVYTTLFDCCDLKSIGPELSKRQVTLAQARLLDVLPKWATLDWSAVSKSHNHEVESLHGVTNRGGGLLDFAALHMIDTKDDILTHVVLIEFYASLLVATKHELVLPNSSVGLEFSLKTGIHEQVANLYLLDTADDLLGSMFLYGPASRYLAVYASVYPQHYISSKLPAAIQKRLLNQFDQSASRWAHSEPPKYDLGLLASLPRISLLPGRSGAKDWSATPLLRLPSASVPPEVFDTLATIFHGPAEEVVTFPQASPMTDVNHKDKVEDAAAARTLYFQYLAHHRSLWKDVVAHAETVAILDRALAALSLLTAVITANWSTEEEFDLPSGVIATPGSGVIAILSPPALEHVIPYLSRPARSFSNLVGGRGDAESPAYRIAMAKYDALSALVKRLSAYLNATPDLDLQTVLRTLEKRLAEGPLSTDEEPGGQIATLEL